MTISPRWRSVASLAWRESRHARRRLMLFMSAISAGVAALVAIDSYAANVTRGVQEQSRALLGADVVLSSRTPFAPSVDSLIDSLARSGTRVARVTNFSSMAVVPSGTGTRLVQVRAIEPGGPFYGEIESLPVGAWATLHHGPHALVDPSVLVGLAAEVGDTLLLGYARFTITGTLENVPGDPGIAAAIGPRVFIPAAYLEETGLIGFGARAEYEAMLLLPRGRDADDDVEAWEATLEPARVRARTVRDTERSLTDAVDQLNRFLGLVGLVALLLGGIGVASAINAYIAEKIDTVAVLRCLGATSGQVLAIYVLEAAALGFVGAMVGAVIGVGAQMALPYVLSDFIPVDVTVRLEPIPILFGLGVGIAVAVLFALLPLLGVRRISPLQALRHDAAVPAHARWWRDTPRVIAALVLVGAVLGIAIGRTGSIRDGAIMSAGIALALGALWLSAVAVAWLARRTLREQWPFVVRQGIANLYRPANQTRSVILALGFGAFLLSTLYLAQANLLQQVRSAGEASRANIVFFDVQPDQLEGLSGLVREGGHRVAQTVPIVPMRVAAVNGTPAEELLRERSTWALRREYRSSFRDTVVTSEKIVAGEWLSPQRDDEVSLGRDLAGELGVTIGDTITWNVQGVMVTTRLTSLREVQWARFEPNFFAVLSPRALEDAPRSYVLLADVPGEAARAELQRAAVDRFPNASSLDITSIQRTVQGIFDRVALAVRFMAVFSVATGAIVLFSAVAANRRNRLREGVLLKTLGATRAQIGRVLLSEYAVLGLLGSLTGMLLSVLGAWGLSLFIFRTPFSPALLPALGIALGMMMLTVAIGIWGGRDVFGETAMASLREA